MMRTLEQSTQIKLMQQIKRKDEDEEETIPHKEKLTR